LRLKLVLTVLILTELYRLVLLLEVDNEYKKLRAKGCRTQFGYKDNLWGLLLDNETLISTQKLCILADGSVMACRRLPVVIGKLPEQRIREIFFESPALNELKRSDRLSKCSSCVNLENCGGCRAIAYACLGVVVEI